MTEATTAPAIFTKRDLATILLEDVDEEMLEAFVAQLPEERLAQAIIRIRDFRKGLGTLEKMLESRYSTTDLTSQIAIDPATGLRYAWMEGARRAVVNDRVAFFDALTAAGFSRTTIADAISPSGIRVTALKDGAAENPERAKKLEAIFKLYRTREAGPPHLKCLDQEEDD